MTLGRHGRNRGRALSSGALEDLVAKHLRAAGVAPALAHPHVLRAYHLTLLDRRGVRLRAIRERSGHADPRTLVTHYLALTVADRDELVEVLETG